MWLSWFYNILTIPLYHYMTSCPPVILILVINGSDNDLSSFSQQLLPEAKWTCHQNIFIFSIRWCIQNDIHQCLLKKIAVTAFVTALQWCHNERSGIWNHQPHDCLLNHLFKCRSKKTSKLCVTGLCAGNSLVIGQFSAKRARNTENVSIWLCHHGVQINGVSWTIG